MLKYHTQGHWVRSVCGNYLHSLDTFWFSSLLMFCFVFGVFFFLSFFFLFLLSKQLVLFFWLAGVVAYGWQDTHWFHSTVFVFQVSLSSHSEFLFLALCLGSEACSALTPAPGEPVPNSVTSGGYRGAAPMFSQKPLCLFSAAAMTQKVSPVGGVLRKIRTRSLKNKAKSPWDGPVVDMVATSRVWLSSF